MNFTKDRAKRTIQITTKFKWPNLELLAKFPAKKFEKVEISAAERAKSTKQDSRQFETNRQKSPTSTTFPSAKIWKKTKKFRNRRIGALLSMRFRIWGFPRPKNKDHAVIVDFSNLGALSKSSALSFSLPESQNQKNKSKSQKDWENQDSPTLRVPKKTINYIPKRKNHTCDFPKSLHYFSKVPKITPRKLSI